MLAVTYQQSRGLRWIVLSGYLPAGGLIGVVVWNWLREWLLGAVVACHLIRVPLGQHLQRKNFIAIQPLIPDRGSGADQSSAICVVQSFASAVCGGFRGGWRVLNAERLARCASAFFSCRAAGRCGFHSPIVAGCAAAGQGRCQKSFYLALPSAGARVEAAKEKFEARLGRAWALDLAAVSLSSRGSSGRRGRVRLVVVGRVSSVRGFESLRMEELGVDFRLW